MILQRENMSFQLNATDIIVLIVSRASIAGETVAGSYVHSNTWYLYIFLLLAGVVVGILLFISLFLFCRFCRRPKRHGSIRVNESAGYDVNASLGPDTADSTAVREGEETTLRRHSSARSHHTPPQSHPHNGSPENDELEEAQIISNGGAPLRQGDDHGKPSLFLQKQKSFVKESSPSTDSHSHNKLLPTKSECEVAVEVHSGGGVLSGLPTHHSSSRTQHLTECRSWAGSDDEREGEVELASTMGKAGKGEALPCRASSTDWTRLESSLDFWQHEHSRPHRYRDETNNKCKVRYNDTGSLEEQYRKLWQLRATLEEDEDRKQPSTSGVNITATTSTTSSTPSTPAISKTITSSAPTSSDLLLQTPAPSSTDQSPDRELPGSHTTSFESNTEPLLEESNRVITPHVPSYEAKRQTYRNILSWRLQPTVLEGRNLRHPHTRQTSLEDTSFDSADTEGSSTDASRLEQATTSFESTTDTGGNTDSTSEVQGQKLHLVQLRADSGYRSLENPIQTPILKMMYNQSTDIKRQSIPSVGESLEEASEGEGFCIEVEDEGIYGLMPLSTHRRSSGHTASKKRRDFGRMSDYPRDYSVDEKSDALFREFSRCDTTAVGQQQKLSNYRRYKQTAHYPHSKLNPRSEDDYSLYLDDETCLSTLPIIRVAPEEDSFDRL